MTYVRSVMDRYSVVQACTAKRRGTSLTFVLYISILDTHIRTEIAAYSSLTRQLKEHLDTERHYEKDSPRCLLPLRSRVRYVARLGLGTGGLRS